MTDFFKYFTYEKVTQERNIFLIVPGYEIAYLPSKLFQNALIVPIFHIHLESYTTLRRQSTCLIDNDLFFIPSLGPTTESHFYTFHTFG